MSEATSGAVEVGGWTITPLSDGLFRLDGGAMWGVVPAPLWRPLTPPDEDNTILLALNCFLAERDGVRVVLEGGIGTRGARSTSASTGSSSWTACARASSGSA